MKKLMFLTALVALCFAVLTSSPVLVWAQGVGVRCDTPNCRYAPIHRGHWAGDGRYDYSPYGYGGYAPDSLYGQGGINIMNPTPGTNLKVEKKTGGFLCIIPLLNLLCSEEKVEFSTALAPGQQTQAKPQAQGAQAYTTPAPPVKEENLSP